jgi:hypothetical protein
MKVIYHKIEWKPGHNRTLNNIDKVEYSLGEIRFFSGHKQTTFEPKSLAWFFTKEED